MLTYWTLKKAYERSRAGLSQQDALSCCSAQLLKQQLTKYTNCFTLAGYPHPPPPPTSLTVLFWRRLAVSSVFVGLSALTSYSPLSVSVSVSVSLSLSFSVSVSLCVSLCLSLSFSLSAPSYLSLISRVVPVDAKAPWFPMCRPGSRPRLPVPNNSYGLL